MIILDDTLFLGRVADPEDRTSVAVALPELNAKIAQDEGRTESCCQSEMA